MTTPVHVVWFKRDLRVTDHQPLLLAAAAGPVMPLYVIEPELWRQADASARQWRFVRASLAELRDALGELGQLPYVAVGDVVTVLEDIRHLYGIAALWSHEETGNDWTYKRDKAVAAWARQHGVPWHERRQTGVIRRLGSRNGWAAAWDKQMAEPMLPPPALCPIADLAMAQLPSALDLGLIDDGCTKPQRGGRRAATATLGSFLTERGQPYRRAMSSPSTGAVACSRLSPHLAWGTLSMREAAQATWSRLRELNGQNSDNARAWRGSLVSFSGRLHWHCHFMQKLEDAPSMEFVELHPSARGLRASLLDRPGDASLLKAWSDGQTGFPFLDACMRSLRATGWLNFRMRAMLMSFASYNLWLPWRDTGLHLARQFTDYEPGIHWPQAQMQSGTTGINTIRIYNVVKQGHDQDPGGRFVRRWVPELADVPDVFVQEPWRWPDAARLIGKRYPEAIVDLAARAAVAKQRIFGMRQGAEFLAAADAVQEKHGSRKSGMPPTSQRRSRGTGATLRRKSNPADHAQLKLDL